MKKIILLFIFISSGTLYSQSPTAFFKALKNKDTNSITNYLSTDVDLCIGSYQDYLSMAEASTRIMEFLNKENPSSFELLHKGASDKSNYNVAKLKCKSGVYRVFIYYEKSGNTNKISEIRFDL